MGFVQDGMPGTPSFELFGGFCAGFVVAGLLLSVVGDLRSESLDISVDSRLLVGEPIPKGKLLVAVPTGGFVMDSEQVLVRGGCSGVVGTGPKSSELVK